jgi:hypothetical protein
MTDRELLEAIHAGTEELKNRIVGIETHLENVTDKNIRIIAEGHADLSRQLDEALRASNERELLLIRLNYLEGEVKKIKERLDEIA